MLMTHIFVKTQEGSETEILGALRSYGFDASLCIGPYDILVEAHTTLARGAIMTIGEMPEVRAVAYAPRKEGVLYVS